MPAVVPSTGNVNCVPCHQESPGAQSSPEEMFDLDSLVRRCTGDRSLAAMLIEKFASRLSGTMQTIERSLAAKDWPQATSILHNLKGEAGNLSAVELQNAASALEESLRTGCHGEAPVQFRRLKATAEKSANARYTALRQLG